MFGIGINIKKVYITQCIQSRIKIAVTLMHFQKQSSKSCPNGFNIPQEAPQRPTEAGKRFRVQIKW